MIEPFIPPDGAMQFEVQRDYGASSRLMLGKAIWVIDAGDKWCRNMDCSCRKFYEVVVDSLSATAREIAIQQLEREEAPKVVVCGCYGEVIE